jgi:hypothetical protein
MAKTKGKKAAGSTKSPPRKGGAAKAPAEKAAKPKEAAPKAEKAVEPKVSKAELDALRKPVEEAKGRMEKAQTEAKALAEKARAVVTEAKDAYRTALAPYREACHKAGVACEYEGGRSANVSEKVSFLVEKTVSGQATAWLTGRSTAERRGSAAKRSFHSRGVSAATSLAGWISTRWSTSTR